MLKKNSLNPADFARLFIGVSEVPLNTNFNLFGYWADLNGLPWCAIFASFCYHFTGNTLPAINFKNGFSNCAHGYNYLTKQGLKPRLNITDCKKGDLVFFFNVTNKRFHHVAIYSGTYGPKLFQTISGNTVRPKKLGAYYVAENNSFISELNITVFILNTADYE